MAATVRATDRPEPRGAGMLGATLASALLFTVSAILPVMFFFSLVAPLPLIVLRLLRGLGPAVTAAFLAASLLSWLLTPSLALGYLMLLVAPGLLIAEAMARGRGLRRGAAWAFSLLATEVAATLVFAGPVVRERALQPLDDYRSARYLAELRTRLPEEQVQVWAESADRLYRAMEVVYPAAFVILAGLVVLANAALLRAYLVRRDPGWLEGGEFEGIRWPFALVVAFVLAGACVVVPPLRDVGYNVLLVTAFFFALQGLAVVAYYANRLAGPPLLRVGLLVLVVANPWAPQILALLGLFDAWGDFRRWADPPAEPQ